MDMFLVSINEEQSTEIMAYDAIIKWIDEQLQRKSELEDKGRFFLFKDISDHWTIKGISSSYEVLFNWEGGPANWGTVSVMRHYDPI